jgi:hypothetical protein
MPATGFTINPIFFFIGAPSISNDFPQVKNYFYFMLSLDIDPDNVFPLFISEFHCASLSPPENEPAVLTFPIAALSYIYGSIPERHYKDSKT